MIMKVVIATHNKDKLKELRLGLSNLNVEFLDLSHFPDIGDIDETGVTLKENAYIKAKHVYDITGFPSIADDTGLEVDALNGAPGVYTARFAGENCSYQDNIDKMLRVMKGVNDKDRGASFKTVISYVDGNRELFTEGKVKGMISKKNKKTLGSFGYDPIFYVPEKKKTFSEMSIDEKNIISHRGLAIKNFKLIFNSYLKEIQNKKESA